uniref:AP-4 complex accessory subunit Tepsin n=1 Tax=Malurus cyaneus samueli TaxID=2593467 RepID=A0A8C5UG47_9PASS
MLVFTSRLPLASIPRGSSARSPAVLAGDWLSRRDSLSDWWKTTSGGWFPDAAAGPGRAGAGSVMAAPLRDRLSFLSRLPVLLRGTADDDTPCPGYLFEEIAKISHESPGSSQCLLEHLLTRLQSSSCHVKLKVLKILLHTCSQGSPQFVLQLKRNASFIREAAVFSGPPDPLHGNSLNQKVRAAAQDLASILFSDAPLPQSPALPNRPPAPAGMGSSPTPCGVLQGFGFSSDRSGSGESCPSKPRPPPAARPCHPRLLPRRAHPEVGPVRAAADRGGPHLSGGVWGLQLHTTVPTVSHQPGQPGGGWEEADSGHSSRESSQGNERSRTSDSGSKSGSDSRSGASRELSHGADRVDADSPGDCRRELSLVSGLTRGARVFLTREEAQHFLKECGLLNCEVVLELLGRPRSPFSQRSMCAISALGCSDLLSPEQIFAVTRQRLQHLSQGSPGPVANRATKVILGTSLCPIPGAGLVAPGTHSSWEWLHACPRRVGLAAFPRSSKPGQDDAPPEPWDGHWGQSLCLGTAARAKPLSQMPLSLRPSRSCPRCCGSSRRCAGQPSPRAPRPPSAPSAGSARDLLMDIPALPSDSFLTPLSPAPTPAAPGEEPGVGSEPPRQPGAAVPAVPASRTGQQAGRGTQPQPVLLPHGAGARPGPCSANSRRRADTGPAQRWGHRHGGDPAAIGLRLLT